MGGACKKLENDEQWLGRIVEMLEPMNRTSEHASF